MQIQSPIVCGSRQMPEPDFAVIRGPDTDYAARLPTAADVLCVVEVADSSLDRDRNEKLPIYARAGVPQYVILNLRDRTAEVYADPDRAAATYRSAAAVTPDGVLEFLSGAEQRFGVLLSSVLPGRVT